jgi:hypothetical protein
VAAWGALGFIYVHEVYPCTALVNTHDDGYEWIPSLPGMVRVFASNEWQGTLLSAPSTKPSTAQKRAIPGSPPKVLIVSRTP